ncbi:Williams-Beuren syndrome chromosomal region 27 protein-like [Plakobranchus ocellatus]|uniref:Williams-Beuren syndrome chromosomal region 27 protein-like n=1 Tax=Plakobranchus ocellatus TaxID=259542 RepID=A0AAV4BDV1_9GAST|nr:Williams-Beuren syndrome chromosomal region 27 protein-like [Plakobranchus ocellatus]
MENAKVLNLAGVTGLIGEALYKCGFRNLDAHDGAQAMVDYCKKTGVFQDIFTCFIRDGHTLAVKDRRPLDFPAFPYRSKPGVVSSNTLDVHDPGVRDRRFRKLRHIFDPMNKAGSFAYVLKKIPGAY